MKKVICFLLALSVIFSNAMPVFAQEVDNPQYGVLNVEYSDALGNIEQLAVMVNDGYVYADAIALSERLGYRWQQSGDFFSIYTENNFFYPSAPLLAVHFHMNEAKVAYNPLFGAEFEYAAPAPCVANDRGVWVPLRYTLVVLGANSTIVEDTLLLQMPKNNVLSIAAMILNNEDTLSFDWISHFGYSEAVTNITDGAGRIVTLFSGLLEFDGDAWLSLLDWSAFDKKFGELLVTMCSTYSADELEEMISQVETSLEVFSDDGKLGEMLRKKQYTIDADVSEWGKECEKYLEMLENGSGSPVKYNLLYQRYEKAMDQQELFSALGGENMRYLQTELSSATNVLDIAAILGSTVTYLNEFQQKDEYLFSSLTNYLNYRTETDNVPNATVQSMHHYLNVMDLGALGYSAYRLIEENWLKCIVDESGLDTFLGAPANVLLFAWDIMSETIPFYSKGLNAVENREISNYAQKVQNDALQNIKYLVSRLNKSTSISAEDCVQLSEYCYVYLKACYIARSAAIKSLDNTSEEFREQLKGKLDTESQINQLIAHYLSVLSNANLENNCYILGFLNENNDDYLDAYSDRALLEAIHESGSKSQKILQQVNITYSDGTKGQSVFKYNSSGLLISSIFTSAYSDGSQETVYSYDSDNRLTTVQLTGDHWHAGFPSAEYNYDANGYLIRSAGGEGSIIEYLYENDSAGRPVKVTMNSDFQTTVSDYTYSESGNAAEVIISVTDYQGNRSQDYASYEFTYDTLGRIQTETRNGTNGSYNFNYIYDYFPFVCVASGSSTPHKIYLADVKGHPIWEIENVVVKSMKQDTDGYLTQLITDSGVIYEFVYEMPKETDVDLLTSENQDELTAFLNISFSDIPAEYTFTSGAGGWSTGLKIGTDGYFEGQYHDSNMGETGDGYPRGTVYYCNFSGKFSEPEPVNEYTYKLSLEQFSVADQQGVEYIENEIKYITSDPYGFDGPNEYYIYLPGIPSSMMPQNAFNWVSRLYGSNFGSYEVYVICSANGELPFVGEFR